jgi:hypothetical protein
VNRRQLLLTLLSLIPFLGLKAYLDKEELAPGTGPDYYAYTIPGCHRIPNKIIYGEPVVISVKDASYVR